MKTIVLQLANDEVCVCARCTRPGGDGGGGDYKRMIQAMRETWAENPPGGIKVYYIYGHRDGVEFPKNSKYMKSKERYWPYGSAGEGFSPVDVENKRVPFAIEDCIYSDTPEGRENLYYKTIDGFQWLLENEDFDYLIRCSAGSYVDLDILKSYLEAYGIQDNLYLGSHVVYNNSHAAVGQPRAVEFGSGSGFILSRNLVKKIVEERHNIVLVTSRYASKTIADDVTIGKFITYDLGIPLIRYKKNNYNQLGQINSSVKNQMHCYFLHTIDPKMIYKVHEEKTKNEI